jgi:hypothetical protein
MVHLRRGLRPLCHNSLACRQWWRLECLPAEVRDTTELSDPNGRCAECIADRRDAMSRILELARMETGQYRLLLEYIGYSAYELDRPSALDVMGRVGREALVEAYQRHEITRDTRSLLFCVLALLDALDLGESLRFKTFGLHVKMTHDDLRLHLVSHASLEKRGLSIGQASIYQMLARSIGCIFPLITTAASGCKRERSDSEAAQDAKYIH